MARSKKPDAEQPSNLRRLDRGELREVTETGIAYLMNGRFAEYTKNETIATVLCSLHDRIKALEDAE